MAQTPPTPLPEDVLRELAQGRTIEAIMRLRQAIGLGLKEAKDAVDAQLRATAVNTGSVHRAGGARLAPGEVPRGGAGAWPWALALAVAALLAYVALGGRA